MPILTKEDFYNEHYPESKFEDNEFTSEDLYDGIGYAFDAGMAAKESLLEKTSSPCGYPFIDRDKEYILCAAIRRKFPNPAKPYYEGTNDICNIEIGYRHHDIYQRFDYEKEEDCPLSFKMEDQGFYTSKGRFVNRVEGMEIAYLAGQVSAHRALNKSWVDSPIQFLDADGNPQPKKEYKHKYNLLFSEDLY
jgi:hypothetical protein